MIRNKNYDELTEKQKLQCWEKGLVYESLKFDFYPGMSSASGIFKIKEHEGTHEYNLYESLGLFTEQEPEPVKIEVEDAPKSKLSKFTGDLL